MTRMRELRVRYQQCHQAGMAALENNDLPALDAAIQQERTILEEQVVLIGQLRALNVQDSSQ